MSLSEHFTLFAASVPGERLQFREASERAFGLLIDLVPSEKRVSFTPLLSRMNSCEPSVRSRWAMAFETACTVTYCSLAAAERLSC